MLADAQNTIQPEAEPVGTLVAVNVGQPKDVPWQGKTVFTGVFKDPVTGPRRVRKLNVDGDGQGDLAGHGGEQRAVFVYQLDSYRYWERELGRDDFVHGQFGENFTIDGLTDNEVCIGDRYRIGTALFEVTQPRVTCYRVGIRMNDPRIPALLVSHHRPGFYFRVLEEGDVEAGDEILKVASGPEQMTVAEIDALLYLPGHPRQQLLRALRIPALSPGWQASFRALLDGEPGSGNAGLGTASPPPAWPGFRRLTVTAIERESDSVISIRLEDPDGAPLPAARPGQYLTVRIRPGAEERSVLRNYSLSGPPGADYYRITVKRERDGAASGYLHGRLAVGDRLEIAAPRGTFILDQTQAPVLLDQRRHRRHSRSGHAPRARKGALREGDLVAPRRPQRPRAPLCRRSPRTPRLTPERSCPHLLQPSRSGRPPGPRLRRCGPPDRVTPRPTRATSRRRGIPVRTGTVHGGGERRPGRDRPRTPPTSTPSRSAPHRVSLPASHRRRPERRTHRPEKPETGPTIEFARSNLAVPWSNDFASLLEFAEACDVPVRWSCRTGVCHSCETALIAGTVEYDPDPVEPPGRRQRTHLLLTATRNVVLDL